MANGTVSDEAVNAQVQSHVAEKEAFDFKYETALSALKETQVCPMVFACSVR